MADKKLKIAIFYNLPSGGAIKAIQDNIKFFKDAGHIVDVYTTDVSDDSFVSLEQIPDNYFVFPVKRSTFRKILVSCIEKLTNYSFERNYRALISYNDFVNTQKEIAKTIDDGNYDFVFIDQDNILYTFTPAIGKYLNTLKIHYCNQPHRENEEIIKKITATNLNTPFYIKIYLKLYNRKYLKINVENAQYMDYIFCNSYFTHENILRVLGLNSKVSYLGVNTQLFYPQNLSRENIIMSVGSVGAIKGFDFIIKSVSKIDKNIRPKLIIVGFTNNQAWANYLISLAKELDVNLEMISNIPYEELIKLYNTVKIVVFAPYLEPFGLIPLEASACGTPIIGVKEGGVKETVKHYKNGLLLERDEDVFAQGMTELLTNQELWDKCSEYGPKYVDEFWSINKTGEKLLQNIYSILEKKDK